MSRQFDVSVRDGQLRMVLTMTGNLAALTDSEPEDLVLYPAEPPDPAGSSDSPGTRFVLRARDDEPWMPLSFAELGDGTPYIYLSGRVTPRTGLGRLQELPPGRPAVTRGWARQAGIVAM